MDKFVGKHLSINCGHEVYQGRITNVTSSHLTLDKACCNGIPTENVVQIEVSRIRSLELIEMPPRSAPSTSSAATGKVERPVAVRAPSGPEVRASPRKLESKMSAKEKFRFKKNEEAFGTPHSQEVAPDFDFEKNLALFDKKAVFNEINASKPDLLRQVESNNYRNDEYVLKRQNARYQQIVVCQPDAMEYVTDAGLIVPSIPVSLRSRLLDLTEQVGLSLERQAELIGRAATETAIHLLGGAHRLNPHNQHQCPTVAVLCGMHRSGFLAASAARQLASHGVRVHVFVEDSVVPSPHAGLMLREISLLRHSSCVAVCNQAQDLDGFSADLIIMSLADSCSDNRADVSAATRWAESNRAPVMALDPPRLGTTGVTSKCCLVAGLPLSLDATNGQVYLCNIGIPNAVFKSVGIEYLPPFGPKFVIPLHQNSS